MQKITPFLWFDGKAEEAANFYVSIFKNSKVKSVPLWRRRSRAEGNGDVRHVPTRRPGFHGVERRPAFKFTEAVSFFVSCQNQQEIDEFWERLSEGGEKSRCGWLKDKYGLSWQIVPAALGEMLQDKNPAKSKRVMEALLQMDKLDIRP